MNYPSSNILGRKLYFRAKITGNIFMCPHLFSCVYTYFHVSTLIFLCPHLISCVHLFHVPTLISCVQTYFMCPHIFTCAHIHFHVSINHTESSVTFVIIFHHLQLCKLKIHAFSCLFTWLTQNYNAWFYSRKMKNKKIPHCQINSKIKCQNRRKRKNQYP